MTSAAAEATEALSESHIPTSQHHERNRGTVEGHLLAGIKGVTTFDSANRRHVQAGPPATVSQSWAGSHAPIAPPTMPPDRESPPRRGAKHIP